MVVEGVVGFGGRVEEVVDDDGAVVARGFCAVVCAANPEACYPASPDSLEFCAFPAGKFTKLHE